MSKTLSAIALTLALSIGGATAAEPVVAAYYGGQSGAASLQRRSVAKLTHLIYAFVPVCGRKAPAADAPSAAASPTCTEADYALTLPDSAELKGLAELKARRPDLKIIASVGGWGMPHFPEVVRTPERRRAFIRSAMALLDRHPQFDGFDIDWEYPGGGDNERALLTGDDREEERRDHAALVNEWRAALDARGASENRTYLLTCAVAGYPRSAAGVDWPAVRAAFDLIFVMTYDFTPEREFQRRGDYSGGGGRPGHHTNLLATSAAGAIGADAMIRTLAEAGAPIGKMALGVGFYGREWKNARWGGDFPAAALSGEFVGTPTWRELKDRDLARQGYQAGYDPAAQAAYWFNRKAGGFISLDDARSIQAKGEWAKAQGLAGLFAWELSQDDGSLVDAMASAVQP